MNSPYSRLPLTMQRNVDRFMQDNSNLEELRGRTPYDLTAWEVVSAWLQYEGLTGYTDTIIKLVLETHKQE